VELWNLFQGLRERLSLSLGQSSNNTLYHAQGRAKCFKAFPAILAGASVGIERICHNEVSHGKVEHLHEQLQIVPQIGSAIKISKIKLPGTSA
jgi:hypothetical protein